MERQRPRWGVYEIGGAVAACDMVQVGDDAVQIQMAPNKEYKLLGFFRSAINTSYGRCAQKTGRAGLYVLAP